MIPATGHEALYTSTMRRSVSLVPRPVVGWNEDGEALVVEDSRLAVAREIPGFQYISEVPPAGDQILPGGGWFMEAVQEDGATWSTPVIAFRLRPSQPGVEYIPGQAQPIVANPEGETGIPGQFMLASWRLFHPETTTGRRIDRGQIKGSGL